MKLRKTLLALSTVAAMTFAGSAMALPSVKILATGGTIAGSAAKATDTTG